jgi:hypothetical protein
MFSSGFIFSTNHPGEPIYLCCPASERSHIGKEVSSLLPVLFYFRFLEPLHGISRFALLVLDAVTLIDTALADDLHAWLKE